MKKFGKISLIALCFALMCAVQLGIAESENQDYCETCGHTNISHWGGRGYDCVDCPDCSGGSGTLDCSVEGCYYDEEGVCIGCGKAYESKTESTMPDESKSETITTAPETEQKEDKLSTRGDVYQYYESLGIPTDTMTSKQDFESKWNWPKCEKGHSMTMCANLSCAQIYCGDCGELCACKYQSALMESQYGDEWCSFCNVLHKRYCDYCERWWCPAKEMGHNHTAADKTTVNSDLGNMYDSEIVNCSHSSEYANSIGYADNKDGSTHTISWNCGYCGTNGVTSIGGHELDKNGECAKCTYVKKTTTNNSTSNVIINTTTTVEKCSLHQTGNIKTGTVTKKQVDTKQHLTQWYCLKCNKWTNEYIAHTMVNGKCECGYTTGSVVAEKCSLHQTGNVKTGTVSKQQVDAKQHLTQWYCLKCNKWTTEYIVHTMVNGKCECGYTTNVVVEKCSLHSTGNIKEGTVTKKQVDASQHLTEWYCLKCNKWTSENIAHTMVNGKCECGYTTNVAATGNCYEHSTGNIKSGSVTKQMLNSEEHLASWYCLQCNKNAQAAVKHTLVNGKCECGYSVNNVQIQETPTQTQKLFNDYDGTTHSWAYNHVYNMKKLGFLVGNPNANGEYDLLADDELVTLHVFALMSRILQNNDVFPEPTNNATVYDLAAIEKNATWAVEDYKYIMRLYGEKYGDKTGEAMVKEIFPNNPNDWFAKSLTREETTALIGKLFGESGVEHTEFVDWYSVRPELRTKIAKAIEMGIIAGDKDSAGNVWVNPQGKLTRIQGITIMYNLYSKLQNTGNSVIYITQI